MNNTINEIGNEKQKLEIILDGSWNDKNKVNKPKTQGTGLTPITINEKGTIKNIDKTSDNWYSYDGTTNNWANAVTKDGSMWVWIPRYAYKINYINPNDKSKGGTIDIIFLKDNTNKDASGNDVTSADYIDEKGEKGAYIVHPAFKDGRSSGFPNGEWRKEITGMWVAKFEAGYEEKEKAQDSGVTHSTIVALENSKAIDVTTNFYGIRSVGSSIKYPVFKANRPSVNNLSIADIYKLSKKIASTGNPYKIENIDSHMMKNSEWGAVVYLAHSKYGRNGAEISVNNVSVNGENTIYAITGYSSGSTIAEEDISRNLEVLTSEDQEGSWTTPKGQTASTTGNIYGIYDLSGGQWEYTAGYIAVGERYEIYAGDLKGESNEYKTKYAYANTGTKDADNYEVAENKRKIGEAIWETSNIGTGSSSWNNDYSTFVYTTNPFTPRGGRWGTGTNSGIFAFRRSVGYGYPHNGFRVVLISE